MFGQGFESRLVISLGKTVRNGVRMMADTEISVTSSVCQLGIEPGNRRATDVIRTRHRALAFPGGAPRLRLVPLCKRELVGTPELDTIGPSVLPARRRAAQNVLPGLAGNIADKRGEHLAEFVRRVCPWLGKRPIDRTARGDVVQNAERLEGASPGEAIERRHDHPVAGLERAQRPLQFAPAVARAALLLAKDALASRRAKLGQLKVKLLAACADTRISVSCHSQIPRRNRAEHSAGGGNEE